MGGWAILVTKRPEFVIVNVDDTAVAGVNILHQLFLSVVVNTGLNPHGSSVICADAQNVRLP